MISLKKKFDTDKAKASKQSKEYAAKIYKELPYFITLITLMASSGISPFHSLKKIMQYDILPTMRKEATSMIKQVEVLGVDPLTVMNRKAEETRLDSYKDFLAGYVATVQTGGSIVNFLKSKMWQVFDLKAATSRQLVTSLAGLVDAYMIIQVVILTMYIMFVAFTSTPSLSMSFMSPSSLSRSVVLFLMIPPIMAGMLMFISHRMTSSTYLGTEKILIKGLIFAAVSTVSLIIMIATGLTSKVAFLNLPYFVGVVMFMSTIKPLLDYQKVQRMNSSAERATPSILRDIAEARKTGLSPERCIVHGFKRKGYGVFSGVLDRAVNQLSWGVPLRKILDNIRMEVSSWFVLINMKILIEVMESGGGYSDALSTLAEASEKSYNVEKEKQAMLKPYVMIAFMIMGITAFTTLLMIDSFAGMAKNIAPGISQTSSVDMKETRQMFASSIIVQSYLVGLFLGKITYGTFAAGFKYSAMLIMTVLLSVVFADFAPIDLNSMFAPPNK